MEDNNLNLDLTLATGAPVNPNPVNPQLLPLFGNHHHQPPVAGGIPPTRHRGKNGRFISIRPILPNVGPYNTDVNPRPQNARPFQIQRHPHVMHNIGGPILCPNPISQIAPSSSSGPWEAMIDRFLTTNNTTPNITSPTTHAQDTTIRCYERKRPKTRQLSVIIDSGMEGNGDHATQGERMIGREPQYETGSSSQQHANATQVIPQDVLEAMEKKIETRYYESNLKLQKEAVTLSAQVVEHKETIKNLEMTLELLTKQAPGVDQPTPLE